MSTILRVLALVPALAFAAAEEVTPAPAPAPAPAPVPVAEGKPVPIAKAPRPVRVHQADLNNIDVRLTLGNAAGLDRVRDDDLDTENTDFNDKSGGRMAVQVQFLRARPGGIGFVVGGGIFAATHQASVNLVNNDTVVSAVGLDLKGGFVYRPTRHWHFELPALVLSGGSAKVETQGAPDSKDGSYSAIALQVGGFYTFNCGFQLGLEIGGEGFKALVEQDVGGGVKHDFIYSGGGGFLHLSAGWRF